MKIALSNIYCLTLYTIVFYRCENNHLESKGLVEDRVECFPVDFGLKLLLLIRQKVDLDVRIRSAAHVQGRQLLSLDHRYRQTVRVEVVFQLWNMRKRQLSVNFYENSRYKNLLKTSIS